MTTQDVNALSDEDIAGMSIEELSAMAGDMESEDDSVNGDSQTPSDQDAENAVAEEKEAAVKPEPEEAPAGIATKAGDKIIPYSVLEETRKDKSLLEERTKLLEQEKAELLSKSEELTKQLQAQSAIDIDDASLLSDEELEALSEELPDVANNIRAMQAKLKTLAAKVEQQEIQTQQQEQSVAKTAVQEAIDSVPKLAFIQSSNPRLFRVATEIDAELRANPEMQSLSMSERFAKVIEQLEAETGYEIQLKGSTKPKIERNETPITSLSDIPGGAPPAVDEAQALLERSPSELGARFNDMSLDQIHSFISRIDI